MNHSSPLTRGRRHRRGIVAFFMVAIAKLCTSSGVLFSARSVCLLARLTRFPRGWMALKTWSYGFWENSTNLVLLPSVVAERGTTEFRASSPARPVEETGCCALRYLCRRSCGHSYLTAGSPESQDPSSSSELVIRTMAAKCSGFVDESIEVSARCHTQLQTAF